MKIPKIGKDDNSKFVELDAADEVQAETSPAEIDAKRAAHSLERAAQQAERGDYAAAILAARQAIALDHDSVEAHGMLGQFLERSGDFTNAAASYAKAIELSPNNALDKASLERVKERLKETSSTGSFSFNESDLNDYSGETTPFDANIAAAPIEAKLPPTRAELEAQAAKSASAAPIVSEIVAETPKDSDLHVAAALPPTTAVPNGIEASLPPTSVGVIASKMAERLDGTPDVYTPKKPISAPLPPTSKSVAAAPKQVLNRRETGDRRKVNVPVAIDRRTHADRRAAKLGAVPTPFVFQPVFDTPKAPLYAQFLRHPSFFGRTLPLVVLAVFSLGFLAWARDRAVARAATNPTTVAQNVPTDPVDPPVVTTQPQTGVTQTNPQPNPAPNANTNDGFDITNNPVRPAANAPVAAPNVASSPASANNTNRAPATNNSPAAATPPRGKSPQFPVPSLQPAPIQPSQIIAEREKAKKEANGNGGTVSGLGTPDVPNREPDEAPIRVSAAPPSVAPPLNPAGSTNNGYIRIRSGSLGAASAPQRPQNQANNTEQAATNAARTGQTDTAIQGLTSAINNNPSDAGFRFQQRASLFLERGDYSRAADDYQSAISAYQEQINRGENVTSARSGLRSAKRSKSGSRFSSKRQLKAVKIGINSPCLHFFISKRGALQIEMSN